MSRFNTIQISKKSLADTIRTIEDQAAKLLKLGNLLGKQAAMEGKASQLREMAAMIAAAHQKFKELLLPLLLGEFGELRKNKYLQFKRLFDATENWPETIPPGRGCGSPDDWSEQDWDAFLSWFFIAPDLPEDLEITSERGRSFLQARSCVIMKPLSHVCLCSGVGAGIISRPTNPYADFGMQVTWTTC